MGFRPWWGKVVWLCAVALAAGPGMRSSAAGWGDESPRDLRYARESLRIAAIPHPPLPPPTPGVLDTPEPPQSPMSAPVEEEAGEPDAVTGWDDPLFEDPRADVWGGLPPLSSIPTYPVVINGSVEALIDYFTLRERERDRFRLWLARSGRYLGMIQRIFRERGLPEELGYTAMIESGFSPRAVSRAGAKGLWQFMEATGRRYGLTINRWVDERLDPVKATVAAARYLGDLYSMFGHWFLAQAAYNAGEARVERAIRLARTTDFWALTQTRHLPEETKMFVPQILAVMVITQAPARYGFEVDMEPPLAYQEIVVRVGLDLETVAALAEVPVDEVRRLNPALRAGITPPFGSYGLRLPAGSGTRFEMALQAALPSGVVTWGVHRVGQNQSLTDIARMYRVTPQRLAEVNQLPGGRLRGMMEVVVPVTSRVSAKAPVPERASVREVRRPGAAPSSVAGSREVVVRRGDTLWGLATRHGLEPRALARMNGLELDDTLRPGDRLKIRTP